MSNFEFVDQIFCQLVEKEKKHGHIVLSDNEETVLVVWHSAGLIENGGLQSFFVWEGANPEVAKYFEKIGMPEVRQIIINFFSIFEEMTFEELSSAERDALIQKKIKKNKSKIETLNQEFYNFLPFVEDRVANYIRETKISST